MDISALRDETPPPVPLRLVRSPAEGLPDPLSSFVGREDELAELARLLDQTRLLTLTGAGGSGKTRLAIEAARRAMPRFADGICWVELAPVEDPALLATAVLLALGERAQTGRTAVAQLEATLADRDLLVVLDNCEHLVEDCANLTMRLLRSAARLRVLATTREPLRVPGELVWPVPALPADAAAGLFVDRARAAAPGFRLTTSNAVAVAEICRRLDGLPLAIELAAARVAALTPEQIAARLDDCFRLLGAARRVSVPHQQTLRATIDWSYALLTIPERILLARLSVFAGGCTLEAAEAVCGGGDLPTVDVLEHLFTLVDRSLVLPEPHGSETRYRLLETVRQYGTERLEASGESHVVRLRHAEFFVGAAELAAAERMSASRDAMVAPLFADLDNIRAALRLSGEHAEDLFVRLAFGLGWCYFAWGIWWEGREWIGRALSLPAGMRREAARARALTDLAYLATYQRDIPPAHAAYEEALAIWEELGDARERAISQQMFAQLHLFRGTPDAVAEALRLADEAEHTLRDAGEWLGVAWAFATLGGIHTVLGDPARAIAAYGQARVLAYRVGHPMTVAIGCMGMASMAIHAGELPRAAALLREALAAHRQAPEYMFLAWTIQCTALLAAAQGRFAEAIRLLGADETLRRHAGAGVSIEVTQPAVFATVTDGARQALGDAGYEAELDAGKRFDMERTIALAESVAGDGGAGTAPVHVPALRIISLGAVRVERHGTPVPLAEWKYAKARELLFLLLVLPDGRTREQIGLALWPDASAEQLRSSLHPVLHHLRRVLGGAEWIIHHGGVYRFERTTDYVFDAESMQRLIDSAARLDDEAAAAALEEAVALYGGDFLEQDPPAGDWHLDRQDALRRRYLDALATLGEASARLGRWERAAEAWRRVILRDDLDERAYRELMRALERLGDRREALRVYDRLVRILRDELDAEPEPDTLALLERLKGGAAV